MATKPHPLPTHKKRLRDEADISVRNALDILLELKPELGRDPRLAREMATELAAELEKILRLLTEMKQ